MTVSALFGVSAVSLSAARSHVEKTLGITLVERESSDRGGIYFHFEGPQLQELFLQENIELPENEPAEEDFPQHSYLLYLSSVPDDSELLFALENSPEVFPKLRMRRR
jgi:hypothetical protein